MWAIYAIIGGLLSNAFNYFNRKVLMDKDEASVHGWYSEFVRLIIFIFFLRINYFFNINFHSIMILIALGLLEVISVYIFMQVHLYTHLSISTIISRLRLVWVPLFAFFLLKEKLTGPEYLGILIIFAGLSLLFSPRKLFIDKGIRLASVSSIVVAMLALLMKESSNFGSNSVVLIAMSLPSVLILPFITKNFTDKTREYFKSNMGIKTLAGLSNSFSMYFYVIALSLAPVGKVSALYQSMMITSIFAGIFLLKEKEFAVKKIIAGVITLVGIYLLV